MCLCGRRRGVAPVEVPIVFPDAVHEDRKRAGNATLASAHAGTVMRHRAAASVGTEIDLPIQGANLLTIPSTTLAFPALKPHWLRHSSALANHGECGV